MLAKATTCGKYEVLFSVNNFEEFCHTPNADRRTQLFRLAHSICRHRLTAHAAELIKRELEAYLEGSALVKENIYDTTDFDDTFLKAIDGTLFQGVPKKPFEEMKKIKRNFLKFERDSKKKLAPLWRQHGHITFDDFYEKSLRNREGRALLQDICVRALGKERQSEQDLLNLDLKSLPGLRCLFKYMCALTYRQLLKEETPRWGSGIDMNHSVFLGYCDIFVTSDNYFLDIALLLREPSVRCMSVSEFVGPD